MPEIPNQPGEPIPAELKQWLQDNAEHDIRVQDMAMRARSSFGLDDGFLGLFAERADQQLLADMHRLYDQTEKLPVLSGDDSADATRSE